MVNRVKSSLWKNLLKYGLAIGLLVYVVSLNWEEKTSEPTPAQAAHSLVAGGASYVAIVQIRTTPGLKDVLSQKIEYPPLACAFLVAALALMVTFIRWHLLVRAQGLEFSRWNAIRLGLVGFFFNTILPTSVGGDILKAIAISKEQSRRTVAVATILIDRVVGLWALAWYVAIVGGIFWVVGDPFLTEKPAIQTIWFISSLAAIIPTVLWLSMRLIPTTLSAKLSDRLSRVPLAGRALKELWLAGWIYRDKYAVIFAALLMSFLSHSGWVAVFHFVVISFPSLSPASFWEHMILVPVGMTAQAMVPLPGGVGGGEAAYGYLYLLIDKPSSVGVLGSMVQRAVMYSLGFIGYLVYLTMKSDAKKLPEKSLNETLASQTS